MLSRRTFSLSLAAACLARATTAAPLGIEPGIQLYMVGDAMRANTPGTLRALRAIGYRKVQTAGLGRYGAREFRRLLDDAGLTCAACHFGFGAGDNGALFESTAILGAFFTGSGGLFGALGINAANADASAYRRMADLANRIGGQAKRAGVTFTLHNHNMEFRPIAGTTGFDLLLKESDPALVGLEMDCGWVRVAGADPVRYLKSHPGRFPLLHIKDFQKPAQPRTAPGGPPGSPLGRGFIDYRPIFAAASTLGRGGVKHYFVEQEPPYRAFTSLEAARISYQYLQSLG